MRLKLFANTIELIDEYQEALDYLWEIRGGCTDEEYEQGCLHLKEMRFQLISRN